VRKISKAALRRLRLREGNIVLVRDIETLEALERMVAPKGMPNCPIVFAPQGVHRLTREYLEKLLDKKSAQPSATPPA
jgi:hypothetical protein